MVHVLLSHWKLPLVWFVGGVSCANAVTDKAAGERWPNAFFAKQGLFSLKHAMKHQAPQKSRATESLTLPITGARRFQIARECRLVIKGPREHRMKLDGFGKIPFLHRRVDCPLNTMIP